MQLSDLVISSQFTLKHMGDKEVVFECNGIPITYHCMKSHTNNTILVELKSQSMIVISRDLLLELRSVIERYVPKDDRPTALENL